MVKFDDLINNNMFKCLLLVIIGYCVAKMFSNSCNCSNGVRNGFSVGAGVCPDGTCELPEPDQDWLGSNPNPASSSAPYRLYNVGSNNPVQLMDYVREIENNLGVKAKLNMMPMQDGDVRKSHADVNDLVRDFDYIPKWNIKDGIKTFIQWYVNYYEENLSTK